MKFAHIADLHIGKRVNDFSMIEDQRYILNQICDICKDKEISGILISGDVYDKSVPGVEAVTLLNDFLCEIIDSGINVFMISGNHDSAERLSFAGELLDRCGMYISPVFDGDVKKISIDDEYGTINVHLLPFIKPINVKTAYGIEQSMSYTEAVKCVLDRIDINENQRNILVAHQFVTGAIKCDSEEISVGGIDNVDASVFDAFDYVALGHIHNPQTVLRETVRYCGTPLKYSFSECKHNKTMTVVELGNKGDISFEHIPLVPLRDMTEIRGELATIISDDYATDDIKDSYCRIVLTDEDDIVDAVTRLRSVYPYVMRVEYDNTRTRMNNCVTPDTKSEKKTPDMLFADLYEMQNNDTMDNMQTEYIRDIINEIWGSETV